MRTTKRSTPGQSYVKKQLFLYEQSLKDKLKKKRKVLQRTYNSLKLERFTEGKKKSTVKLRKQPLPSRKSKK